MANYLSPLFNEQTFDDNGDPLVGGLIETYEAGTSAPLATYTTQNGVVQHSNPIILDARGEPADPIWLAASQEYKFVLKTAAGVTIRTIDDVSGVNDVTASGSEWIASGFTPTYISATSFSVDGDRTGTLSPGRRLQTTNTGGTIYSTVSTSTFGAGITTVVVRNDTGVLDSGITTVNYGILASDNPSTPNSQDVRQAMGLGYGVDIASAATLPLSTVTGEVVRVTGTVTTTAVTMTNGQRVKCIAVAAWPLTYHASNLPLPGSTDYTCSAGDMVIFTKDGNGDLTIEIIKKNGSAVVGDVQIQPISASVAANALTISSSRLSLDFRSTTLGSGTVTKVTGTPSNLVLSSGSTLGTVNGIQSDIAVLAMNNAGTIELAAVNIAGGVDLSETGLISTTAEGGAGGADSATVIYSTTARTNLAYRVIGIIRSTQATAGTWATAPSLIQGAGGNAITSMQSLGYGQTWQNVTGSRVLGNNYYNTTGKPIQLGVVLNANASATANLSIGGVSLGAQFAAGSSSLQFAITNIVPPGQLYVISATGVVSVIQWNEFR